MTAIDIYDSYGAGYRAVLYGEAGTNFHQNREARDPRYASGAADALTAVTRYGTEEVAINFEEGYAHGRDRDPASGEDRPGYLAGYNAGETAANALEGEVS